MRASEVHSRAPLGHASIETTLDRYRRLIPEIHQEEARKLDRLAFGSGPNPAAGPDGEAKAQD